MIKSCVEGRMARLWGTRALVMAAAAALAMVAAGSTPASASVRQFHNRPIVAVGANQSNNWSGYNQGTVEQGGKRFQSVSGAWTVPVARAHKAGENEYS